MRCSAAVRAIVLIGDVTRSKEGGDAEMRRLSLGGRTLQPQWRAQRAEGRAQRVLAKNPPRRVCVS